MLLTVTVRCKTCLRGLSFTLPLGTLCQTNCCYKQYKGSHQESICSLVRPLKGPVSTRTSMLMVDISLTAGSALTTNSEQLGMHGEHAALGGLSHIPGTALPPGHNMKGLHCKSASRARDNKQHCPSTQGDTTNRKIQHKCPIPMTSANGRPSNMRHSTSAYVSWIEVTGARSTAFFTENTTQVAP